MKGDQNLYREAEEEEEQQTSSPSLSSGEGWSPSVILPLPAYFRALF